MMQMDARIAELVARLTALERERTEIVAEINTLRSARSGKTAAIEGLCSSIVDSVTSSHETANCILRWPNGPSIVVDAPEESTLRQHRT